jgi:hypothetical protein
VSCTDRTLALFHAPESRANRKESSYFLFVDKPPGISVSLQVEHKQFIGNGHLIDSSLR